MEWIKWICMLGVIFILIPVCLYNGLKRIISASWVVQCILLISIPLNGFTFGLYHQDRELKELKYDGLWTTGTVIDKEYKSGKGPDYWAVQLEYYVDSVRYITNWEEDEKNEIEKGQILDVIYLDGFPKIYRVNTGVATREDYFE
ncbi:MAG: hypothetical protein HOP08_19825 [Cyclobacteriaceae bacterium]|nr:hypothetical protein [Cyclobacteriaceae bacterium]